MQLPSSLSTRLQYQHKSLLELIDGLSDEQIRTRVIEGKWSIFENVAHLETYQQMFIKRVQLILEGNKPVFEKYVPDTDPAFIESCNKSSREVIQHLLTTRKDMAAGVISFNEEDFTKTGTHMALGEMNLILWLNFFLLHEAHHLFTIFKLAAEVKKSQHP